MARWRGSIDARVGALEREVSQLVANTTNIDRSVTRVEGRIDMLRGDLNASREEVRAAAKDIDRGREDAVLELKQTISAGDAWKLGIRQIVIGCLLTAVLATVSSLIVLGFSGQLG